VHLVEIDALRIETLEAASGGSDDATMAEVMRADLAGDDRLVAAAGEGGRDDLLGAACAV
jgi:hypothetical protein